MIAASCARPFGASCMPRLEGSPELQVRRESLAADAVQPLAKSRFELELQHARQSARVSVECIPW